MQVKIFYLNEEKIYLYYSLKIIVHALVLACNIMFSCLMATWSLLCISHLKVLSLSSTMQRSTERTQTTSESSPHASTTDVHHILTDVLTGVK